MKKHLLLIPILIFSTCKKESKTETIGFNDSIEQRIDVSRNTSIDSEAIEEKDSIVKAPLTKQVLKTGVTREIDDHKIILTVDAERLPLTINEEFTKEHQELVLKINDFPNKKISAKINTNEKDFNIRFNQIKTPDEKLDGPFGRELQYEILSKGEVLLIIGKSNMASGKTTGRFSLSID